VSDGPTSLKRALFTHKADAKGRTPKELLLREIRRIRRALIASFFHINKAGHRRYADMAVARYKAHRRAIKNLPPQGPSLQLGHLRPSHPGGPESLEERLTRFGLRGPGSLRADVGHQYVDAIRVTVSTSRRSTKGFASDLFLRLVSRKDGQGRRSRTDIPLNFPYYKKDGRVKKFSPQLEPGLTDEFSIDVSGYNRGGGVLLRNLIGMVLLVGPRQGPTNQTWRPVDISVDINGIKVLTRDLRGINFGPGDSRDLNYPNPPQVTSLQRVSTSVRGVTVSQ
jgi:hypothetical protein